VTNTLSGIFGASTGGVVGGGAMLRKSVTKVVRSAVIMSGSNGEERER
jgi:hypothetical protein